MAEETGFKDGQLILPERTEPADQADHAQIWTESDNTIHIKDGAGAAHKLAVFGADYGEMDITGQVVATIETANTPHACIAFSTGVVANWSFIAGITGAITLYADYSGTVANAILATCVGHGLTTGNWITIRGTAGPNDYNGVRQITKVNNDTFYFVENGLWNADAGASDFEMGDCLTPDVGADGIYEVSWNMSADEGGAAGSIFQFEIYINGSVQTKVGAERKFSNNDVGSMTGGGIITIAASDVVWFSLESDGTNDLTIERANFCLFEI